MYLHVFDINFQEGASHNIHLDYTRIKFLSCIEKKKILISSSDHDFENRKPDKN